MPGSPRIRSARRPRCRAEKVSLQQRPQHQAMPILPRYSCPHPQLIIIEAMVPCYRDADKHDSCVLKWFSPGVLLQHQFALHSNARRRIGALALRIGFPALRRGTSALHLWTTAASATHLVSDAAKILGDDV